MAQRKKRPRLLKHIDICSNPVIATCKIFVCQIIYFLNFSNFLSFKKWVVDKNYKQPSISMYFNHLGCLFHKANFPYYHQPTYYFVSNLRKNTELLKNIKGVVTAMEKLIANNSLNVFCIFLISANYEEAVLAEQNSLKAFCKWKYFSALFTKDNFPLKYFFNKCIIKLK